MSTYLPDNSYSSLIAATNKHKQESDRCNCTLLVVGTCLSVMVLTLSIIVAAMSFTPSPTADFMPIGRIGGWGDLASR